MKTKIAITAIASISPLGNNPAEIWSNYCIPKTLIKQQQIGDQNVPVAQIPAYLKSEIEILKNSDSKYKSLDNSVLFAIYSSRQAIQNAGWNATDNFGINIGSSRGATELFENHHEEFLKTGKTPTLTSPNTTLGNISTWVAHDLKTQGPEISHSITCSTALHALLNGIAWLQSGMASKFLVGGSEAPLTPFTIAQMQALKIYSKLIDDFPCRAFDLNKKSNSMVLGEGASMACLEIGENQNALCYIEGIGYATDTLEHNISISDEALCFQKSMKMAL
ncbi:MAG: beta-ketoacyl synthase, partial [Flavobacterium sp.]|nr:beta-ketoacyl synthase [Flavobacterium sp.]